MAYIGTLPDGCRLDDVAIILVGRDAEKLVIRGRTTALGDA